jgi:tetratricopeptide (TPR) repeat protein
MFYFRHGLFNESVQYSLNELEICQNIHGYNPEEIIRIFDDIARCYNRMLNYSQAFVYMEKAFQMSQSIEQINSEMVRAIQNRIDNFVRRVARRHIELPWIPLSQADEDIPW